MKVYSRPRLSRRRRSATLGRKRSPRRRSRPISDTSISVVPKTLDLMVICWLTSMKTPSSIAIKSFRWPDPATTTSGKLLTTEYTALGISHLIKKKRSLEGPHIGSRACNWRWSWKYSIQFTLSVLSGFCLLLNWGVIRVGYLSKPPFGHHHFSVKFPAASTLNAHISFSSKRHKLQNNSTVTPYFEAFSSLLQADAIDDVIIETDADRMRFTQPSNRSPT